jgi:hypothetical protein
MKYSRPKSRNFIDSSITIRKKRNLYANQIWLNKELINFTSTINNNEWLDENVDGLEDMSSYWAFKPKNSNRNFKDISNGDNNVKAAIDLINTNRLPYYYYYYYELLEGKTIGRLYITKSYKNYQLIQMLHH